MVWRRILIVAAAALAAGGAAGQSRDPSHGEIIFEEPVEPEATEDSQPAQARRPAPRFNPPEPRRFARLEAELDRVASPTLARFTGDAEFSRYLRLIEEAKRARDGWWHHSHRARRGPLRFAQADAADEVQSDAVEPVCPEEDPACASAGEEGELVVTGSRIAPRNPSITNNQMRSVEEGDIVKQIDDHLLILQDGRIFAVDTRAGGGRRLALSDRADVYRNPESDMWYDEMLVFGDRILVAGYSYDDEETELAIFRLSREGKLSREGVFRLSSDDYYSGSNYATRLIGDTLVLYTPLDATEWETELRWPVVRRWLPEDEAADSGDRRRRGRPLLDAASIYRPVRTTYEPVVHTLSMCPLGQAAERAQLECRTTAVTGPPAEQWYVTEDTAYLWLGDDREKYWDLDDCDAGARHDVADAVPGLLYALPLSGGPPSVLGVRGAPPDQFAMQEAGGRFHALLRHAPARCDRGREPAPVALLSAPLSLLSQRLTEAPRRAYADLPPVASDFVASRFTERHLVYGGLSHYRRGLPDTSDWDEEEEWAKRIRAQPRQPAYALAIDRPGEVRPLDIRHTVIRAERVGDDIVLTGYRDRGGLFLSFVKLAGREPGVGGQLRLQGRYESEGRSHAFNSRLDPDGTGVMGLPTVRRISDSGRHYWRSRASDLSFVEFGPDGEMSHAGALLRRFDYVDEDAAGDEDEDGIPGYKCEVSCIDWYGNSRPIFTDGRIFALAGTELIEGRLAGGRIAEVQRINVALTPAPR